jgi:hypothetical protein
MRESTVEAHLFAEVQKRGGWCLKLVPTKAGIPDRMVLLPGGRMYLVELKQPKGKVSAIQLFRHQQLLKRGYPVAVLWTVPEVNAWLENLPETKGR